MYHASPWVFTLRRGLGVAALALVGFVLASGTVASAGAPLALAVIAGGCVLIAVPVGFVIAQGGSPAMLGLRRPAARFLVAGALLGSSQWFLNLVIVDLLDRQFSLMQDASAQRLAGVVAQPSLVFTLLAIAVMPAVAEEIVFRGVLARSLATRLFPVAAILASAIAFSAFHMSLVQAVPTLLLGIVYAYVALNADSAIPTIVAHLINNTLAILVGRGELPWLGRALAANEVVTIGAAVALCSAGIALARRSR